MITYTQRRRAKKRYINQRIESLIREQELCARCYAHARQLYEQGELTPYTQGIARTQYINVRRARNALERELNGGLFWSYQEIEQ